MAANSNVITNSANIDFLPTGENYIIVLMI